MPKLPLPDTFRKIAVWNTAFLGDAVLTLSLIRALKAAYPEAQIHFFVRKGYYELFRAHPDLAEVHEVDKHGTLREWTALRRFGRECAAMGFDLWISPHRSPRSAFMAAASRAPVRIGYDSPFYNRLAYTHTVPRRFGELQEIERILQLLIPLGLTPPARPWGGVLLITPRCRIARTPGALRNARSVSTTPAVNRATPAAFPQRLP